MVHNYNTLSKQIKAEMSMVSIFVKNVSISYPVMILDILCIKPSEK